MHYDGKVRATISVRNPIAYHTHVIDARDLPTTVQHLDCTKQRAPLFAWAPNQWSPPGPVRPPPRGPAARRRLPGPTCPKSTARPRPQPPRPPRQPRSRRPLPLAWIRPRLLVGICCLLWNLLQKPALARPTISVEGLKRLCVPRLLSTLGRPAAIPPPDLTGTVSLVPTEPQSSSNPPQALTLDRIFLLPFSLSFFLVCFLGLA